MHVFIFLPNNQQWDLDFTYILCFIHREELNSSAPSHLIKKTTDAKSSHFIINPEICSAKNSETHTPKPNQVRNTLFLLWIYFMEHPDKINIFEDCVVHLLIYERQGTFLETLEDENIRWR